MAIRFIETLHALHEQKVKSYQDLGYPMDNQTGFFSPLNSINDWVNEFGAIFLKFWDCILNASLKALYFIGSLFQTGLDLCRRDLSSSVEHFKGSMDNLMGVFYFTGSAIVDAVGTIISLFTRSLSTLIGTPGLFEEDNSDYTYPKK